jgi:HAD superfamily hydrolase (TIGR01509 family)
LSSRPFQNGHPKAIIFDMDGLIFDTERLYQATGSEMLARRGKEFSEELRQRIMGVPGVESMRIVREALGLPESPEELYVEAQSLFRAHVATDLSLMPGLLEILARIEERGIPKALATSTRRDTTDLMLARYDFHCRFAPIVTSDLIERGKPDPEIYELTCRMLGVPTSEALVLEDSYNGVLSAKRAGCRCVAVPHDLSRCFDFSGADLVVDSLLDDRLLIFAGLADSPAIPPR